jgi:hypothetical protein
MYLFFNSGLPRKQSLQIIIIIFNSGGIAVDAAKPGGGSDNFSPTSYVPKLPEIVGLCKSPVHTVNKGHQTGIPDGPKNVPDCCKCERPHTISCYLNCGVQDAHEQHNTSDDSIFNKKLVLYLICGTWIRTDTSIRYPDIIKYCK